MITWMMERTMDKRRILEIYLNVAEWGDGVFGAEAAARHHFGTPAPRARTRSRRPASPPSCRARGAMTAGADARISAGGDAPSRAHDRGGDSVNRRHARTARPGSKSRPAGSTCARCRRTCSTDSPNAPSCARSLDRLHPADIASILEALPLEERLVVWDLVKADRDGEILLEVSDAVRESLIADMDSRELVAAAETLDADEIADIAPDLPPRSSRRWCRRSRGEEREPPARRRCRIPRARSAR